MDRGDLTPCRIVGEAADGSAATPTAGPWPSLILPSRSRARESCRSAIASGLVLLTGEAGVGKTWLWRSLADERAGNADWVAVDVGPTTDPDGLVHAIARALGAAPTAEADRARAAIADALWEAAQEGHRHVLVIDEAHNADDALLEEVRVAANRIGQADGWAGILICGQTSLVRRLRARFLASLEARLRRRIHLGPIDLAEAAALLGTTHPAAVEGWHRDSRGNPARLLRNTPRTAPARSNPPPTPIEPRLPLPTPAAPPKSPLIQVAENVVEVGWDPSEAEPPDPAPAEPPTAADPVREEVIHDPYATLQAWQEWSQGDRDAEPDTDRWTVAVGPSQVRAEPRQPFSPYGDLFGRPRPLGDPE